MNQYTDINRLKKLGKEGVKLLLADSTYAEIPGHTQSEKQVSDTLHKLIKQANGRIIIATFASLISRIQIAIDAAEKNNKKIFVVGTSMVNNVNMARKLGYLKAKPSTIVSKKELNAISSKKLIIICTGSQGEPTSALTRMANQTHQIIDIQENDTVILSSNPVPGNEMKVAQNIDRLFNLGAKVIFIDCESSLNPNISISDLKKKLSKKTKVVVVMHYGGYPCDMKEIMNLKKKYKFKLIEDACHAIFSDYKNKTLGTFGDYSAFSFYANKNLTSCEGGLIYCKKCR